MTVPNLTFTELREVSMEHLQRVWHTSKERLPFRTPRFVPFLGLACAQIVETRFLELAMSLLDFSPWIPLGSSRFCFLVKHLFVIKVAYGHNVCSFWGLVQGAKGTNNKMKFHLVVSTPCISRQTNKRENAMTDKSHLVVPLFVKRLSFNEKKRERRQE